MNMKQRDRCKIILKLVWLTTVILISYHYSFIVYPVLYAKSTNSYAKLYFMSRNAAGNAVYWQNTAENRSKHLSENPEKQFLFISINELYPPQQVYNADPTSNWMIVLPGRLKCNNVDDCYEDHIILTDEDRLMYGEFLYRIKTKDGKNLTAEPNKISQPLAEPSGWGEAGRFPIFLVFVLFGIKLGMSLRDYFSPTGPVGAVTGRVDGKGLPVKSKRTT